MAPSGAPDGIPPASCINNKESHIVALHPESDILTAKRIICTISARQDVLDHSFNCVEVTESQGILLTQIEQ
jgi:hypothetical protein